MTYKSIAYGPLADDKETFAVAEIASDGLDYRLCECVQESVAKEIAEMYSKKYNLPVSHVEGFE